MRDVLCADGVCLCVCACVLCLLCKWDVVIDDMVDSSSFVENTAGSVGVVVEDGVVEGTAVSSCIVRIQLAVIGI